MQVDKSSFLLALGALAAGSVGGYFAGQRELFTTPRATAETSPVLKSADTVPARSTASATVPAAPAAPACDDSVGTPAACPAIPYPSDEGGCAPVAAKRCEDFKQSMKPRIAERAVACLNALTPAERCDPVRVNLCGHMALMSACDATSASDAAPDDVASRCQSIHEKCGGSAVGPTSRDCVATIGGMTAVGRDRMVQCLSAHCTDKGLFGCEAVAAVPGVK